MIFISKDKMKIEIVTYKIILPDILSQTTIKNILRSCLILKEILNSREKPISVIIKIIVKQIVFL